MQLVAMDLLEFSRGPKGAKGWLNIVAGTIQADSIEADTITADTGFVGPVLSDAVTLTEQASVPNPAVGKLSLFANLSGQVSTTNALGDTITLLDNPASQDQDMNNHAINNVSSINGIPAEEITSNAVEIAALIDQTRPVAPAGLRDFWNLPSIAGLYSSAGFGYLRYDSVRDILYALDFGVGTNYYSTDGGASFSPMVFDVPPADPIGYDLGTNGSISVMLPFSAAQPAYRSTDGINFVAQAVPPQVLWSFSIVWLQSASLFIAGAGSSGNIIMTSPTGVTWTQRTNPNLSIDQLGASSTLAVATSVSGPAGNTMYSSDGINWTLGTGMTDTSALVIWSDDKKEWFALGNSAGEGFRSDDGKTWTSVGISLPGSAGSIYGAWVGSGINRYYIASSIGSGYYSLASTDDLLVPFSKGYLDGSTDAGQPYGSVFYMPARSRFIMNTSVAGASSGITYSTAELGLKATIDNIRVRGYPVSVSAYSLFGDIEVKNTVTESDISTSASSIGSLIFQQDQPSGMVIKADLRFIVSSAAGDTLTLRLKVNGTNIVVSAVTVPALAVDMPMGLKIKCVLQNNTLQYFTDDMAGGFSQGTAAYDRTLANTFLMTAQWGANVNDLVVKMLNFSAQFPNGA